MGKSKKDVQSFEELLRRTEEMAAKLESGDLSLDESLETYEKGVKNLRLCAELLRSAEEKVKLLVKEADGFRLEDFGADNSDDGQAGRSVEEDE